MQNGNCTIVYLIIILIMLKIVENNDSKDFNSKVCACASSEDLNAEFLKITLLIKEFSSSDKLPLLEFLFAFWLNCNCPLPDVLDIVSFLVLHVYKGLRKSSISFSEIGLPLIKDILLDLLIGWISEFLISEYFIVHY